MASVHDCELALQDLVQRLSDVPADVRGKYVVPRTLACRVTDLEVVFLASLGDAGLSDLRCRPGVDTGGAQVRLAARSDDLLAIVAGSLSAPSAWATGRLKVEASVLDLLKLRTLL